MNESFDSTVKFALVVAASLFYLVYTGWLILDIDAGVVESLLAASLSFVLFASLNHFYNQRTRGLVEVPDKSVMEMHYYNPALLEGAFNYILGVFYVLVITAEHLPLLEWFNINTQSSESVFWIIAFGMTFSVIVTIFLNVTRKQ